MDRKRVAIVGSGCAGLGAAWALKDTDYEIHLFEKEKKLGGHTNTEIFQHGKHSVPVDTGFIVMNTATYPNFIRFLNEVKVETVRTEMTFAVSRDHGRFEWSGDGKGIFAQRRNFFRPRHWRMIFDIIRFNTYAVDVLDDPRYAKFTIGEYLSSHGYSKSFCDDYLIPMTAAVWSTSPDKASLDFPAQTLIRFLWNHHLLSTIAARPDWLTIPGGSQRYIDAITTVLGTQLHVHLESAVLGVARPPAPSKEKVRLFTALPADVEPEEWEFDHVVFACHGDQILDILNGRPLGTPSSILDDKPDQHYTRAAPTCSATSDETAIFSAFQTTSNVCYLHSDLSLMPTRRDTWSSWNYLINTHPMPGQPAGVSLTYNMNILQHIPTDKYGDVLVTMNPDHRPRWDVLQGEFIYRHPLYTLDAIRAQERLQELQGRQGVSFCGAWTKYGFHEDGFSSGLKIAMDQLGATLPFEFEDSTCSRGRKPALGMSDMVLRFVISVVLLAFRMAESILSLPGVSWCVELLSVIGEIVLDSLEDAGVLR